MINNKKNKNGKANKTCERTVKVSFNILDYNTEMRMKLSVFERYAHVTVGALYDILKSENSLWLTERVNTPLLSKLLPVQQIISQIPQWKITNTMRSITSLLQ